MQSSQSRAQAPLLPWQAALALAAALLAQAEVLHYFSFRGAQLSLVLVLVVWYAMRADLRSAAVLGLVAGACEDFFGTQTGGAWTISTTLIAVAANLLARGFFPDSLAFVAAVVAACALLRRLLFWIVMSVQGYPAGFAQLHFHQAMWEAAIDAAFAVALIGALRLRPVRRVR